MVKLTSAFLTNSVSKFKIRQSKEPKERYLKKVTHLQLQDRFIDSIGDFSDCKKLTVLYLHNNCLTEIDNLQHAVNLTHLYLQKNKIKKIDNLSSLKKLKKLYLGHNYIAVVEGLESVSLLEELHIEKQHLPKGESLYFDPRTIKELSKCLQVLNVSSNGLQTISDLAPLHELYWFMARDNQLTDMQGILQTVSKWHCLRELELTGNLVCSRHKYRESIIAISANLELLDGKKVSTTTREFLKRLELSKVERQLHGMHKDPSPHSLTADIDNLTKHFPPGVRRSISRSILRDGGPKASTTDNSSGLNALFPAWRKSGQGKIEVLENSATPSRVVPRPFWKLSMAGQHSKSFARKSEQQFHLPKL